MVRQGAQAGPSANATLSICGLEILRCKILDLGIRIAGVPVFAYNNAHMDRRRLFRRALAARETLPRENRP